MKEVLFLRTQLSRQAHAASKSSSSVGSSQQHSSTSSSSSENPIKIISNDEHSVPNEQQGNKPSQISPIIVEKPSSNHLPSRPSSSASSIPSIESLLPQPRPSSSLPSLRAIQQSINPSQPYIPTVPQLHPSQQSSQVLPQLQHSGTHKTYILPAQPILLPHSIKVKEEHPPFRPALPYVIDGELSIEKEVDPKKPKSIDVDDHSPTSIKPFYITVSIFLFIPFIFPF